MFSWNQGIIGLLVLGKDVIYVLEVVSELNNKTPNATI